MKRLLLLRHAKAVPGGAGIDDRERELTERGREDAPKIGRYLRAEDCLPDLIVVSPSKRTVETVELVTGELGAALQQRSGSARRNRTQRIDYMEALYLAESDVILSLVRLTGDGIGTLMVVGHNPGLENLATVLTRDPVKRKERDYFDRIEEKFPTAALAILAFDVERWREVSAGGGALTDFVRPYDL